MDRDPIEKLLFLYLLTNTLTNIVGIYEISLRRIAFDTGIDSEMVKKILERFEADNKIKYEKSWIAIKNFTKHQLNNPKINIGMETLLKEVPNYLIEWVNIDYDRLSHLNTNPNTNLNTNLNPNKEDTKEMPITTSSDVKKKDKENTLIINQEKEKKKPNHIEFDYELWSWHGIDDDIIERWAKIFPNVEVNLELVKMREFFKTHPGHEKVIEEKFKGNYAIYIYDWLARSKKYIEDKKVPDSRTLCSLPKNSNGVCSHLWGTDCKYTCCTLCPEECNSRCAYSLKNIKGRKESK